MKIVFVMGPAFSGKSMYIRREFPGAETVNISPFQKAVYAAESNEEISAIGMNADLYCMEELRQRVQRASENTVIVLEHHLLRKEERAKYLETVRQVSDAPVECIVLLSAEETVAKILEHNETLIRFHQYEKEKMEMPDASEGFACIRTESPEFSSEEWKRN